MRIHAYQTHMTLVLLLLLTSGPLALQAGPGGNKGGNGKGSSEAGGKGMGAKGGHGVKTGKPAQAPETQLAKHTKLSSKLAELLPEGTDLTLAATGFKNLGQFVAAVHVAHNLGIPFDALKVEMVDNGLSLGQAIHLLKPAVDADEEAEEAETEAETEVKAS